MRNSLCQNCRNGDEQFLFRVHLENSQNRDSDSYEKQTTHTEQTTTKKTKK